MEDDINNNEKAVIRLRQDDNFALGRITKQKNIIYMNVKIKDKMQIENLLEILRKEKMKHVMIEELESICKDKMDKIEVINKFTDANIKCLELQNGFNNYCDAPTMCDANLFSMILKGKTNIELQKNKKTLAYIYLKEDKGNREARYYILKSAEEKIKKYAEKNGLEISDFYIDYVQSRIGIQNREALKKILNKIKEEEIGQILIPKIEYLSRNTVNAVNIINKIMKDGTRLVCCDRDTILG